MKWSGKKRRKEWLYPVIVVILLVVVVGGAIYIWATEKEVAEGEIYLTQGHLTKKEAALNEKMIANAIRRFSYINEQYLHPEGISPFLAIIPDKNYYLTSKSSLDYEKLISEVTGQAPYMTYIDITDLLEAEDFYKTDSHWRQERILDVAERIADKMGANLHDDYVTKQLEEPFYGVYYDEQFKVGADTIYYLDSSILEACKVSAVGEDKELAIYDMQKAKSDAPYEMFLSGTVAVLNIENPYADSDKKLIIFRDSFGSSLAPLLVSGYGNITMIDIRYVQSTVLSQLVDFSGADVLFLYSTLLLNNSMGMK